MRNKAISGIIATILLVLIAIALVGVAYVFFSGMVGQKTSKTFSIGETDCISNHILLTLTNDGTEPITVATDLKIFVEGVQDTSVTYNPVTTIATHTTSTLTGIDNTAGTALASGTYTVMIVGPSNTQKRDVTC
ncbi:MAG: hypothetical protein COY38_01440 [Candidatus Aenigmarchaeota archaeon CG_4_10_14_0_8_um_filter_37_24]|nr:hypothetical protein [Candidatus Aenigmarchaeota archaeon]OIN88540.1 MAG: hypothetical protein AUJ50_00705 [Candidatus Aenigmarchaeota archaeon CG1_02_38_14]PIV68883.1 MAG: hypothetical protein COS07_02790 [Candidatus Aenigmarchaeota archaeon CG01_land_8_20_14_3_00_37_9]PIW41070.1 MAG: hypothetical protein COW21_03725 [Candidatus Aenigmarchaeota archaeon CG15_BIG_FIL_POST_REV_8_21_14_020_37_27]PIX50919.1 MAG: hypothetical protein COZ52_01525 [Candidatus Aenigmarchaeota archaeon CG_4_8_14_3_u